MARVVLLVGLLVAHDAPAQWFADEDIDARVGGFIERAFADAIAEYDDQLQVTPGDTALAVDRCAVITAYAYNDFTAVEDDVIGKAEQCLDELAKAFPGNPDIEIARLEGRYDDDLANDTATLKEASSKTYNRAQQARLSLQLARALSYSGEDTDLANQACATALESDLASPCRLEAADYYLSQGQQERAIDVLLSPLDSDSSPYHVGQKVEKLLSLRALDEAIGLLDTLDVGELGVYSQVPLAEALAEYGFPDRAKKLLSTVDADYALIEEVRNLRYQLALASEDYAEAKTIYDEQLAADFWFDPLARNRLGLFAHAPRLPWTQNDLISLVALLAAVLLLALGTALPALLVHYRGLIRRVNGISPEWHDNRWTLRSAAYAMFVVVFGSLAVTYVLEIDFLYTLMFDEIIDEEVANAVDDPRLLIFGAAITGLLLLPLLAFRRRFFDLGAQQWSFRKCLGIGVGTALAVRFLMIFVVLTGLHIGAAGQITSTTEAIIATLGTYGLWPTMAIVAVAIPIIEEVVFRGAMLRSFASHVSLRWANLSQSVLFAALHDSLLLFPVFVGLGYLLGSLSIRAGGLLPAIICHSVFNATGVLLLLGRVAS
ncbi:MAG: CPBP family glutamic-type intramembrane protease [Pseudomonadota bacterium]